VGVAAVMIVVEGAMTAVAAVMAVAGKTVVAVMAVAGRTVVAVMVVDKDATKGAGLLGVMSAELPRWSGDSLTRRVSSAPR